MLCLMRIDAAVIFEQRPKILDTGFHRIPKICVREHKNRSLREVWKRLFKVTRTELANREFPAAGHILSDFFQAPAPAALRIPVDLVPLKHYVQSILRPRFRQTAERVKNDKSAASCRAYERQI